MAAKGCPCDMRMGAINVGNRLDKDRKTSPVSMVTDFYNVRLCSSREAD
jgi:hypothetical protein